jgi:hypothetical protein
MNDISISPFLFMLLLPATSWSSVCGIFLMVSKLFLRIEFCATHFTSKRAFFFTHILIKASIYLRLYNNEQRDNHNLASCNTLFSSILITLDETHAKPPLNVLNTFCLHG